MPRTVTVSCPVMPMLNGAPALTFARVSGHEAISELFTYNVELKTPGERNDSFGPAANLDLKGFVGKEMTVSIELEGSGPEAMGAGTREISGLVTDSRFARLEGRGVVYEMTLRPWLWLATRTTDYKIFQHKTVVDILDEVLGEYGYPVEKRLTGGYPQLDFQVQYGESDFAFIQRIMQEWGIYWYFEHAEKKHRLIVCDSIGAHKPFASAAYQTLLFHPGDGGMDEERIFHFDRGERLRSGAFATNDFDFARPDADLLVLNKNPRETGHADQEVYEWPGDYTDPGTGDQLARVRMEERRSRGLRSNGVGNLRALVPGCVFTLKEHPHQSANCEYLILGAEFALEDAAEESGAQNYYCRAHFEAHPTSEVFRPRRTVAKPRTRGPQTATVTGPSGQEIWTDEYGRVKVKFHWDRYNGRDENSSCWVRVSYPWAGSNFGAVHIPRIGQEVIVDFLNGDPDLPIITGRVYNANNMPPWPLPDNATQSGILTRSSLEGGVDNANAIRFEDKKGEEELWIHAEKDQLIEVENDELHTVGHDREKMIDNDERVHVKHDRTERVDHDERITIGNDRTEKVGKDEDITVGANRKLTVGADHMVTVAGKEEKNVGKEWSIGVGDAKVEVIGESSTQNVGTDREVTVGKSYKRSVADDMTSEIGKSRTDKVGEALLVNIGKDYSAKVGKKMSLTVEDEIKIVCGKSSLIMDKDGNITLKGEKFKCSSGGDQTITADGNITIKGQKITNN